MLDLTNLKNAVQGNTIAIDQVVDYVKQLKATAGQAVDPGVIKQLEDELKESTIKINAVIAASNI